MIAAFEDTKLSTMLKNLFETNTAFFIKAIVSAACFVLSLLRRMIKLASFSVPAITSLIELAYSESIRV
jgi:hypothetical protein